MAPVAGARAEARWLAGESEAIAAETDVAVALAIEHRHAWLTGVVCLWRRRAGLVDDVDPDDLPEPYRLELEGAAEAAAERWSALGCPYEAALALAHADTDAAQRRALAELQRLGAQPPRAASRARLRERGMRDVRRGPRAATRENPAGLTARELEVVALVAEGLRNAEIAGRLFVSEKTVAHHVSAILRKLDVATRSQAGAEAARLGHRRKIGSPPDVPGRAHAVDACPDQPTERSPATTDGRHMDLYVILRRSGWRSPEDLGEAAARSKRVADEEMPDDIELDPQLRARRGRRIGRDGVHLRGLEPRGDPQARHARRPAGRRDHRGRGHGHRAARSAAGDRLRRTPGGLSGTRGGDREVVARGLPRAPGSRSAAAARARRRGRSRPTAAPRR